jgi:macrocin-O-methyltransferase TylF-like protien
VGLLANLLGRRPQPSEFGDTDGMAREIARLRGAYLQLMKDCLIGFVYKDPGHNPKERNAPPAFHAELREIGLDWPHQAHSMIGNKRMLNLWEACETVIAEGVPGDFIETGAWRGGACIFMRAVLKAYGIGDRTVWVADSFAGLPPPDEQTYPHDRGSDFHEADALAIPVEIVQDNFRGYGLLDEQVRFLKGWFKDTLPAAPIGRLAVLRLDGDMYESTMDALRALYDKVSPRGYVIVDDYTIPSCRRAVDDFRQARGIADAVHAIDQDSVYWRKGER